MSYIVVLASQVRWTQAATPNINPLAPADPEMLNMIGCSKCYGAFTPADTETRRRGSLMVSARLVSGSSGPGSSPGWGHCSWARHFSLTVPLSTQVYECVPANLMLGVTLRWTSIPSRGE